MVHFAQSNWSLFCITSLAIILDVNAIEVCARKEKSLLFDQIEGSHKSDLSSPKNHNACATCSELPSSISTMDITVPAIDIQNIFFR